MDIIVGDTELTPHRRTALRRCVWPRVQHILAETEFRINQDKRKLKDALRVRDAFYLWLFPDLDPDQMALPKLPPGAMERNQARAVEYSADRWWRLRKADERFFAAARCHPEAAVCLLMGYAPAVLRKIRRYSQHKWGINIGGGGRKRHKFVDMAENEVEQILFTGWEYELHADMFDVGLQEFATYIDEGHFRLPYCPSGRVFSAILKSIESVHNEGVVRFFVDSIGSGPDWFAARNAFYVAGWASANTKLFDRQKEALSQLASEPDATPRQTFNQRLPASVFSAVHEGGWSTNRELLVRIRHAAVEDLPSRNKKETDYDIALHATLGHSHPPYTLIELQDLWRAADLTPYEEDVWRLQCEGFTEQETAIQLKRTVGGIKQARMSIRKKIDHAANQ